MTNIDTPLRILIVESRFYNHISDALLAGAKAVLEAYGAAYDVVTVPGAFELKMPDIVQQGVNMMATWPWAALFAVRPPIMIMFAWNPPEG
jgi:6,7-dimethyl-8-ribityllumazine synthase